MFVIGIFVGIAIAILAIYILISLFKLKIGTLKVDRSDPNEPPYLFLELSESVNRIVDKKIVVLKVDTKNYISQK